MNVVVTEEEIGAGAAVGVGAQVEAGAENENATGTPIGVAITTRTETTTEVATIEAGIQIENENGTGTVHQPRCTARQHLQAATTINRQAPLFVHQYIPISVIALPLHLFLMTRTLRPMTSLPMPLRHHVLGPLLL